MHSNQCCSRKIFIRFWRILGKSVKGYKHFLPISYILYKNFFCNDVWNDSPPKINIILGDFYLNFGKSFWSLLRILFSIFWIIVILLDRRNKRKKEQKTAYHSSHLPKIRVDWSWYIFVNKYSVIYFYKAGIY